MSDRERLLKILDWSIEASDGNFLYRPWYGDVAELRALRAAVEMTCPQCGAPPHTTLDQMPAYHTCRDGHSWRESA
jgi:hypothetical protein